MKHYKYKKQDHVCDSLMFIDGTHDVLETDFERNILDVLKAAHITNIALLPKYLTHDSPAVRQMAEMSYIRLIRDAKDK